MTKLAKTKTIEACVLSEAALPTLEVREVDSLFAFAAVRRSGVSELYSQLRKFCALALVLHPEVGCCALVDANGAPFGTELQVLDLAFLGEHLGHMPCMDLFQFV